jgi:phage/plasmid primase-like uncharacterized protein
MHDPISAFKSAIVAAIGAAPDQIEPGKLHRFATRDRRGDDAGFCKLFDDQRGGVYGCNRQFPGQVFTWSAIARDCVTAAERAALNRHIEIARRDREIAQGAQWRANAERLAKLWDRCIVVERGDPVSRYLEHRLLCDVSPVPECLRLHPALPYKVDGETVGTWPAMVAQLTAPDGRLLALHRTWLTTEGRKAPTPGPCKKLTPTAGDLAGGCIQLGKPAAGQIGIAEGVETALAAFLGSGVPAVAAYSAGALAAFLWPPGVHRLVIFADADPAGADAANKLRQRARFAGLRVEVLTPTTPGADWCDVWAQRDAVGLEGAGA